MSNPALTLPNNVLDALGRGKTIEAIKLLRESSGLGLAEAKSLVDAYLAGGLVGMKATHAAGTLPGSSPKTAKHAAEAAARVASSSRQGLSPGEVPKSGGLVAGVVLVAIIGVAAYFLISAG